MAPGADGLCYGRDVNAPIESAKATTRLGFGLLGLVGATLFLVLALPSCATLSEEDCLTVDWGVLGETDGQLGRPLSELNRYRRDCAEYGVVPDSRAYTEGRERGLAVYCTESSGYREGRDGTTVSPVCPAALEPGFRRGYGLGRAVYVSLTDLRASNDAIASARMEVEQLESDIADHRASIRSDGLGEERKAETAQRDRFQGAAHQKPQERHRSPRPPDWRFRSPNTKPRSAQRDGMGTTNPWRWNCCKRFGDLWSERRRTGQIARPKNAPRRRSIGGIPALSTPADRCALDPSLRIRPPSWRLRRIPTPCALRRVRSRRHRPAEAHSS